MARIKTGTVQVDGLRELSKALKQLEDKNLGKELQKANKAAANLVASAAKGLATTLGSTPAHVAPSIRASAGRQSASVSIGGAAYPMAAGAEFGGQRRPTTQQFQPWRGSDSNAGYFLYPTIRAKVDEIVGEYADALDELLGKAFPD